VDAKVASVVSRCKKQVQAVRESVAAYETDDQLNSSPSPADNRPPHPPHWVERMTVTYLEVHGGIAKKTGRVLEPLGQLTYILRTLMLPRMQLLTNWSLLLEDARFAV